MSTCKYTKAYEQTDIPKDIRKKKYIYMYITITVYLIRRGRAGGWVDVRVRVRMRVRACSYACACACAYARACSFFFARLLCVDAVGCEPPRPKRKRCQVPEHSVEHSTRARSRGGRRCCGV